MSIYVGKKSKRGRPRVDSEVKSSERYAELQRLVRTALKQHQAPLAASGTCVPGWHATGAGAARPTLA